MEEDAGKSLHEGFPDSDRATYVDYNRSGTPLIEIVTEPDLRSASAAAEFFTRLRAILVALGVNDGNMEEGSLRCDANVSVRPVGETKLGTKAEVKNLNSFRFLKQALEHEIERQIDLVSNGERVRQETRLWDAAAGRTVAMRSKEEAHDYRYFPEPDLPPLRVDAAEIARLRAELPELPDVRKRRLVDAVRAAGIRRRPPDAVGRARRLLREDRRGVGQRESVQQLDHGRAGAQDERDRRRHHGRPDRARAARRTDHPDRQGHDQRAHRQRGVREDVHLEAIRRRDRREGRARADQRRQRGRRDDSRRPRGERRCGGARTRRARRRRSGSWSVR